MQMCSKRQNSSPSIDRSKRDHRRIFNTSYSHFHDFPGSRPDSTTFQAWKMRLLNSRTF